MTLGIEVTEERWVIAGGGLVLAVDRKTGCLSELKVVREKEFVWTQLSGDVTVRDDLLRKTFDRRDLKTVRGALSGGVLSIEKHFEGAPWCLKEEYKVVSGAITWNAGVAMDSGDFRSCAVSYCIPWPQILFPMSFWAAKEGMPSAPYRFAEISLEYGEVTSGIMMPALCCYREKEDAGLLVAMPFDFKTPRFSFISEFRDSCLRVRFDWMALSSGKPARTSLLFRGTGGAWRPALGWLYEQYKEYFEPRSKIIHNLWGGHVSGIFHVSLEEARVMADLGLKWHEIHAHFPAYGNYHPEGLESWRGGHDFKDRTLITPEVVRTTIKNLHAVGSAALPYIQVSGDVDVKLADSRFPESKVLDVNGNPIYIVEYDVYQLNSDPALPFGRDISRQIDGMVTRYPEIDGVFLDQACYNWLDTGHDDGISAKDNRPCYMTGFNYFPHLEHLSARLHPDKVIIGNAPYGIGIMKYIDGFMAEGSGWLCDHLQYYGLAKPIFFLMYNSGDRDIELMFQRCLIYAAGYTSYAHAQPSRDLYEKYRPLVERLFRRRWIFDADPLRLPSGFKGGVFRSPSGTLLASVVSEQARCPGRPLKDNAVCVRTADSGNVTGVTVQTLGAPAVKVPFKKENGAVVFDVPGDTVAAVAELHCT